jgi:hypothetical protein
MTKIAQPEATVPGLVEAVEKVKNAINKRNELGDAAVAQLRNAAERATPSENLRATVPVPTMPRPQAIAAKT